MSRSLCSFRNRLSTSTRHSSSVLLVHAEDAGSRLACTTLNLMIKYIITAEFLLLMILEFFPQASVTARYFVWKVSYLTVGPEECLVCSRRRRERGAGRGALSPRVAPPPRAPVLYDVSSALDSTAGSVSNVCNGTTDQFYLPRAYEQVHYTRALEVY